MPEGIPCEGGEAYCNDDEGMLLPLRIHPLILTGLQSYAVLAHP